MTREEEIKISALDYVRLSHRICPDEQSFFDGAEWADKHPQSPWISVKDSPPYQYEELVCSIMKSGDGTVYGLTKQVVVLGKAKTLNVASMINKGYGWEWDRLYPDIEFWMPIPELPKE